MEVDVCVALMVSLYQLKYGTKSFCEKAALLLVFCHTKLKENTFSD